MPLRFFGGGEGGVPSRLCSFGKGLQATLNKNTLFNPRSRGSGSEPAPKQQKKSEIKRCENGPFFQREGEVRGSDLWGACTPPFDRAMFFDEKCEGSSLTNKATNAR